MYKVKTANKYNLKTRLLLRIIDFNYKLRNFIIFVLRKLFFKNLRKEQIKKILIFRSGGLGDSVNAIPAINEIKAKFPEARFDLLTNFSVNNTPGIPEIIPDNYFTDIYRYKRFLSFETITKLRREKYDLFIELPANLASLSFEIRSMFLARVSFIKSGIGWKVSTLKLFKKYQEKYLSFFNETERLFLILKHYGIINNEKINFLQKDFYSNDIIFQESNQLLALNSLTDKNKNIALIISAGRIQNKWPLFYFQTVAKYFRDIGFNIFILGGEKEKKEAEEICNYLNHKKVFNFCGLPSVIHTAEILKECKICISNDTGAMHLAYNIGTPVIALFSNRDFSGKWFPPSNMKNVVLRAENISCTLCFSNTCSNNICMQEISPELVIEEALKFL